MPPPFPTPRGPLSDALFTALSRPPHPLRAPVVDAPADPLADDDLQLALYCCYELHYRGFERVDDRWEWQPSLLGLRAALEAPFEAALRDAVGPLLPPDEPVPAVLRALAAEETGPSLSRRLERSATRGQLLEFLVHRSAYQLKEADPHSWALPRLDGPAKAALAEIQYDEYGGGRPERVHARMFADVLDAVGLDSTYGAYLDLIPGVTLATVNLMSLLGLHRRLRGALCGHLALFEMTSCVPNRRYATALRRLGFIEDRATAFFEEHVEADAVHECVAAYDLAGNLALAAPQLAGDIVWGALALDELDRRWAAWVIGAWDAGRTSLRSPLAAYASTSD